MRLVIDMLGAQSGSRDRGIGRLAIGLARALVASARGHDIWLAVCEDIGDGGAKVRANFPDLAAEGRIVSFRSLSRARFSDPADHWRMQAASLTRDAAFAALEPDAILAMSVFEGYNEDAVSSSLSGARPALRAVVAYDLIPLQYETEYLSDLNVRKWYSAKLGQFSSYDLFLAISEATKNEAIRHLNLDADQVATIMAGADDFDSATIVPAEKTLSSLGISKPYFVYAASWEWRKNFRRLIEAFSIFLKAGRTNFQLVLVTDGSSETRSAIAELTRNAGLNRDDVIVSGYVDDPTLHSLYRNSIALVYASLSEGFGLPILEAMRCGTAVVCSNTSSMPEIMRFEAATFDPTDTSAIATIMARLVDDEAFRTRLIQHGSTRGDHFTWEASALATWQALEGAVEQRSNARPRRRERWARHSELLAAINALPAEPIGPSSDDLAALSDVIAENLLLYNRAPRLLPGPATLRLEGPIDSSYSLALVNRETARALHRQGVQISILSSEGPGDFEPNMDYLMRSHADIVPLLHKDRDGAFDRPLVVARDMYPPRVADMAGDWNILSQYAWEESRFPSEWVDDFNLHLDGIACLSTHVKKVLQDSGVAVPLAVTGAGVDHWEHIEPTQGEDWPGKGFRFLHVSSCFPRKGADVLLKAFGKAFRASDDVSLVIKTFPNPHNDIEEQLASFRTRDPGYPNVVVLFDDLSVERLKSLYQHCHVLVAPSRAEGYGLPLAEAMISGLPVVTTAWSGQLDFCKPEWSWLVDYKFAPAQSHFELSGSVWAEPDVEDLTEKLRQAATAPPDRRAAMARTAKDFLLTHHSWDAVAKRQSKAVSRWMSPTPAAPVRIGWVSTWNCVCGIAAYSEHLISRIANQVVVFGARDDALINSDGPNVRRCWSKLAEDDSLEDLEHAIGNENLDAVVIQFNYGFFNFARLAALIERLSEQGKLIFIVLHATIDHVGKDDRRLALLANAFRRCARVLVHSHHDMNRLNALGVVENVSLVVLGIVAGPPTNFRPHRKDSFVIGSYGFCLPHKGLMSLVSAFGRMAAKDPTLRLQLVNAVYPADESRQLAEDIKAEIVRLKMEDRANLMSDFLSDADSMQLINQCDLLVFAYEPTNESASAAVRFGIASGRPVATTAIPIFDDVKRATFQIRGSDKDEIMRDLERIVAQLREGGQPSQNIAEAANRWRADHAYDRVAAQLTGLIQAIVADRSERLTSVLDGPLVSESKDEHPRMEMKTAVVTKVA